MGCFPVSIDAACVEDRSVPIGPRVSAFRSEAPLDGNPSLKAGPASPQAGPDQGLSADPSVISPSMFAIGRIVRTNIPAGSIGRPRRGA